MIPPEAPYVSGLLALRRRVRSAAATPATPIKQASNPSPNPPAAWPNTGVQYVNSYDHTHGEDPAARLDGIFRSRCRAQVDRRRTSAEGAGSRPDESRGFQDPRRAGDGGRRAEPLGRDTGGPGRR